MSAGYSSSGNPLPGAGLGTTPLANIGVMVTQALPYPGKLGLKASMAARDADAALQQVDAVRLSVIAQVKEAYYRLAYADAVGGVLGRNRELLDTLLEVSEARYAVGRVAQQDVIKAQTQLSVLELQTERVRQALSKRSHNHSTWLRPIYVVRATGSSCLHSTEQSPAINPPVLSIDPRSRICYRSAQLAPPRAADPVARTFPSEMGSTKDTTPGLSSAKYRLVRRSVRT